MAFSTKHKDTDKKESWKTKKNKEKKKKKLKRAGNLRKSQTKEKVFSSGRVKLFGTRIGILSRFNHFKLNRIKSNLIGWILQLALYINLFMWLIIL